MQIMLSKGFGGAERLFVDCCQALASEGMEVIAVCHPEFVQMSGLNHERISIFSLKVSFDYSPFAFFNLRSLIRKTCPDVIHTHLCRASLLGGTVGRMMHVPVAANIHNYVKLKYYKNISCFVPGTEDQKNYLIGQGIDEENVQVIPHFSLIRSCVCSAGQQQQQQLPTALISYGRFVHKKGFDLLIDAVGLVKNSGYEIRLILGGDGPEKSELKQKVKELALENHIEFYGWVQDVERFLQLGPIFILPSLDEPFGIVVLEAMAQGKTIISSKSQGPLEILNKDTAWMFEVGEVEAMAGAIMQALDNYEISQKKARLAHADFRLKYSHEVITPRYIAMFERIQRDSVNQ